MTRTGRPALALLAGPSGVGQDAVRNGLVGLMPFQQPLTYTTRPRRPRERDGRGYRFIDEDVFKELEQGGEFAETAVVHGRRYGTPVSELRVGHELGIDTVLIVDVQGAEQTKRQRPQALGIFLLPENTGQLRQRLEAQGMDPGEIRARLATNACTGVDGPVGAGTSTGGDDAGQEMRRSMGRAFDHRIVNREGRLDETVPQVLEAIRGRRA